MVDKPVPLSRRTMVKGIAAGGAALSMGGLAGIGDVLAAERMNTRPIPKTGELMPMVGVGTSRVFNVSLDSETRARLSGVLKVMIEAGGKILDSSPMYGAAEKISGDLIAGMGIRKKIFIATKVWTSGREEGIRQMRESMRLFKTDKIELMQVHNLVDWRTQLKTVREWKEKGIFKYVGITNYSADNSTLAHILRTEPIDFLQVPYSIANRTAERVLFPLCRRNKVAVVSHRNFERGRLFGTVRGKALPGWAADYDIKSWGQFFLKWVLADPASTCVIPGTSKIRHMVDNVQAGMGRLPDAKGRERMARYFSDF